MQGGVGMKISINNNCTDFESYRAARVKSLFNVDSGANFNLEAELPIDDQDWSLGLIVGPSGSGKTSIGNNIWGGGFIYNPQWPERKPIIDAIAPKGNFDQVTGALSAVGLGSVPTWLRPYKVLSNGEKFRADLARVLCDSPGQIIIDEFSSVVDRQIAKVGAGAFSKAWKRTGGQAVLLSCHYDIIDWLQADWIFDTSTGEFIRGCLRPRPKITLKIFQTNWRHWPLFEPHHYLKLPHMIAATNYVATVGDQLVAHLGVSTRPGMFEARACRLVVMPEWQGAGVGIRFLNYICEQWRLGKNRYDKPMYTIFHTSHPGLAHVLRRNTNWTQISSSLHGDHKGRSKASLNKNLTGSTSAGFGGHFRAVQGFRYLGVDA